jgi:hypothetical protein
MRREQKAIKGRTEMETEGDGHGNGGGNGKIGASGRTSGEEQRR